MPVNPAPLRRLAAVAASGLLATAQMGSSAGAHDLRAPDAAAGLPGAGAGGGRLAVASALVAIVVAVLGTWSLSGRLRAARRPPRRSPVRVAALAASALALLAAGALPPLPSAAPAAAEDPSVVGAWSPPFDLPVKGIHVIVLPNGKGILFSYPDDSTGSRAVVWNPVTGASRDVSLTRERDIFCTGHSLLADGRVFLPGGHLYEGGYGDGVKDTEFYDPWTETWSAGPLLTEERWYPTSVQLGDGRVLIFGGTKTKDVPADTVESFDPATNTIVQLPDSATKRTNSYPRMHLLPTGRVALVNQKRTELFDSLTNTWSYVDDMNFGGRGQSSNSVLLPDLNRVLQMGGQNAANGVTATAEIIDFSEASPQWRYTASMTYPRVWANAVLLPDGTVLEVGGGGGGVYANPVPYAELFDPVTETWRVMAAQQAPRVYHSTAVLLPDGRVLSAGQDSGSYQYSVELYSPPYLFKGARPSITSAPATVGYGQQFAISTRDASDISRVALVRPDSVTHSINFDQRQVTLAFSADGSTTLSATSPAGPDHAPPGWYMLFLLNSKGVPSVASWVQLGAAPGQARPTIAGFDPASGPVGTTVYISGSGFTGTSNVTFNDVSAAYAVDSDTLITAAVPSGATTGPIQVSTTGGSATSATSFTVTSASTYRDVVLADGPVGYWRLGETSGDAVDETGNAAAATYNGGVTRGVPGALAGDANLAARFDGTDDYVSVPDNSALDVGDVFTYELWIKRGAMQGVTQRLIHKGAGPAALGFNRGNKVVLVTGGSRVTTLASSTIKITDQNWHHIVATKNGPDVHLYVDGVDVTRSAKSATMTSNTADLNIARAANARDYFDGDLDEVAVYPVALSAADVVAHYQAGVTSQ